MKNISSTVQRVLIAMAFLVGNVYSAALPAPHQLVQESVDEVLAVVRQIDSTANIATEDVNEFLVTLEPVVAFDAIARAVVGSHGSALNDTQQSRFSEKFKRTMTRFYMESMVTFGVQDVTVRQPQDFDASAPRARVRMDAVDRRGNAYEINYTMVNSDGQWQMQNMIVDGVNVGLTYRNQFDSAMSTNDGDVDRVIQNWEQFIEQ
jgi:phospholipid transport system substrate-binding protein